MPSVLLTRPRARSEETAAALAARGVGPVVVAPLIEIDLRPVPPVAGGLLLTSRNAVAAWAASGNGTARPAWCVGPRTAADARAAGLDVRGHAPDAAALAEAVPVDAPALTHLRGEVARGGLVERLRARGLRAGAAVVYGQAARPLSAEGRRAFGGAVVAPVYSPRAARLLGNEIPPAALSHVTLLAISAEAAAACPPAATVRIAARPDGAAMLDGIEAAWRERGG
ncbi:uroporphyrinogen-III synthase [Jannaschia sp. Os4]|uniref:uroporphyrinogen-III synthase n=1 Tax=Jannaschia sp. Os4 TaxID=2807617 RepID=UPI001939A66E|nr:uroporphyrinogen-III synthase [Jannaschia sp. Os4]MBM2574913.1 uroporphyrinogen-III synthase [Jannaschia sp. Os4]